MPDYFLELPEALIQHTAQLLLAIDWRSALRLRQCCHALQTNAASVRQQAEKRRLQWDDELSTSCQISCHGRVVRATAATDAWVCGGLLPTTGTSRWRIYVDHTRGHMASICMGVCDHNLHRCWTLAGFNGYPYVDAWNLDGSEMHPRVFQDNYPVDPCESEREEDTFLYCGAGGDLLGVDVGAVVEITLDHDLGKLYFRTKQGPGNDGKPRPFGPRQPALPSDDRFPAGAQLRPLVRLFFSDEDLDGSESIADEYDEEMGYQYNSEDGSEFYQAQVDDTFEEYQAWLARRKAEGNIGYHQLAIGWLLMEGEEEIGEDEGEEGEEEEDDEEGSKNEYEEEEGEGSGE